MNSIKFLVNLTKLNVRYISTNNILLKSHYDSLGITPKATQTDIKTAYYKLSMVYHPDKNKGSINASKKFQDILNAYEVLGNFKLRRLYDKGLLHTTDHNFTHVEHDTYSEHPQSKFYQSREKKNTSTYSGTPIYDFDEWSRAHYGATFDRSNRAKQKWRAKQAKRTQDIIDVKNESVIIGLVTCLFIFLSFSYIAKDEYDTVSKNDVDQ